MTACVLYSDEDFEAITVIDVPQWAIDMLQGGKVVQFAPQFPMNYLSVREVPSIDHAIPIVQVFAERLRRNGRETLMLFTRSDEWALRLRSTLLPGQRGDVQQQVKEAFIGGFLSALGALR